ncbi:MAG: hypothetical protein M3041_03155 [Acidobacteriota bacterium]|nr:hypothetical protein [Acidobacteriota bacterium]
MFERLLAMLIALSAALFGRWWRKPASRSTTTEARSIRDHERTDVHVGGVAIALASLALFLVLVAASPLAILPLLARATGRPSARADFFRLPPAPRLQVDPDADLARRRDAELRTLERGGRMPIERAMAIVGAGSILVRTGGPIAAQPLPGVDATQNSEAVTSGRYIPAAIPASKTKSNGSGVKP